jgi:hypothetical protein
MGVGLPLAARAHLRQGSDQRFVPVAYCLGQLTRTFDVAGRAVPQ